MRLAGLSIALILLSGMAYAQTPSVATGGVLNAASLVKGQPVTLGSFVAIFGSGFGNGGLAGTVPWPTSLGGAMVHVKHRSEGRGHSPLDLRLGDDVRRVDDGRRSSRRHHTARLCDEPASVVDHADPFAWAAGYDAVVPSPHSGRGPECWRTNAAVGGS